MLNDYRIILMDDNLVHLFKVFRDYDWEGSFKEAMKKAYDKTVELSK